MGRVARLGCKHAKEGLSVLGAVLCWGAFLKALPRTLHTCSAHLTGTTGPTTPICARRGLVRTVSWW